eukprot:7382565-Prymnesium_polylepis.1
MRSRVPGVPPPLAPKEELSQLSHRGARPAESNPAHPLSSTQELSTAPSVPSCSPHSLPHAPESASPAPQQLAEPCALPPAPL